VSALDLVLLLVVGVLAVGGFRRGLVVGVLSLVGLVVGGYAGIKLAPELLGGTDGRYTPLVAFGGAVVAAALGQSLALVAGRSLRTLLTIGPLAVLDRLGGGLLGAATGLVLCWVVGAILLYAPGQVELRRYAQDSVILSRLNDELPPARVMDALSRVDPFTALGGPKAEVGPANPAILSDPDVEAASASVVRVTGYACGLGIEGTGWIAADGTVVTNAHVVAGVEAPRVDRRDGDVHAATVVGFDRKNDIAVLRVPGLEGAPLPLEPAGRGTPVALLGYPENGPFEAAPARLGQSVTTLARDAYGSLSIGREVVTIRGTIRPGNSGGPAVDAAGRVRTVVYAQRLSGGGGFGVPVAVVREALARAGDMPLQTDCVDR
jgi:S1-C subfamily serine protease